MPRFRGLHLRCMFCSLLIRTYSAFSVLNALTLILQVNAMALALVLRAGASTLVLRVSVLALRVGALVPSLLQSISQFTWYRSCTDQLSAMNMYQIIRYKPTFKYH